MEIVKVKRPDGLIIEISKTVYEVIVKHHPNYILLNEEEKKKGGKKNVRND